MNKSKIWFVIPAYNEENSINIVINNIQRYYKNIVVINDASQDRTPEIAKKEGAIVLTHMFNLGQGAAIQTGIEYALLNNAEIIVTFDADGQHLIEDVIDMIKRIDINSTQIICGSRFMGVEAVNMPRMKKFTLKLAVLFTRFITKINVSDAHNGLRVMTRGAGLKIDISQNKMAHATEFISLIRKNRIQYLEHPVKIIYTDYSLIKGQKISNSFNILLDLLIGKLIK